MQFRAIVFYEYFQCVCEASLGGAVHGANERHIRDAVQVAYCRAVEEVLEHTNVALARRKVELVARRD